MIRVRVLADDSRPIKWPPKHPFWETGFNPDDLPIVVSYADNLEYIYEFWPEAEVWSVDEVSEYIFNSRFEKPDWFKE